MHATHSNRHILAVALAVCFVCSAVVTTAAVLLRPVQETNRLLDRQLNALIAAGLLQPGEQVQDPSKLVEARLVDLASGEFVATEHPEQFDPRRAAKDPARSIALSPEQDIALIKRRANQARVYLVRDASGEIETVILPVHGYALWSQIYGFLALEDDGNRVVGLRFYEHAETPGLGGKITDPEWLASWKGKQVYDEKGQPAIRLVKGPVDEADPEAKHQVDALSGATLTTRGVEDLLHFWLGPDGFGPFLAQLRNPTQEQPR